MSDNKPIAVTTDVSYDAPRVTREPLDGGGNYVSQSLPHGGITPVEGSFEPAPLGDGSIIP
ncbi:MAG: hypothetical protein GX230_05145 [Lentisphaerae bacterium]|jgi:hypothetical protein|nr:hypothetical protein [Lentisphaerota bacterium]